MNDVETKTVVMHILERMGFKGISKAVKDEAVSLDAAINYIKYKSKEYKDLISTIDYFL